MKKKLIGLSLLLALAFGLTGCGPETKVTGDLCDGVTRLDANPVVVYAAYVSSGQESARWFNSLVGRTCNGRPIMEVLNMTTGGEYGTVLYALVKLG